MDLLNNNNNKKGSGFNILGKESTTHGGYGAGTLNLDNMTPVIVDVTAGEAYVEMGAMHARSDVEKGIKFLKEKEEVPNGKPYWLVWITVDQNAQGSYYAGVTACEMTVDREIRRGYKSLPEHVNKMDKSLKRQIIVDHMDNPSKEVLGNFLKGFNEKMYANSEQKLRDDLGVL
ncbi:YwhD family protein [Anaerobacillus sp. CMMVII]|uniref:YwhD family protein n=1 Tax=Anaerobacillus sp. CMMVII TaxID=2755588 RepID=UPI0021B7638C|nr:YwhD family protein [Anaerobacillus sp. CMMVII]MCT8140057.1 YwhD family protein [Anaerobacillus sp. CMMVII]